jgi:septation ring formation regulator EzrA
MAVKQDFAKQLESQIAVWQAQIKEHQDKMAQAGAAATAEAKATYEKSVAALQAQTEQATKLLAETRTASEAAWHDLQAASAKALEQLQQGWADALKRFG